MSKLERPVASRKLVALFEKLGADIKIARLRRRWTEAEMAKRAGLSLPTYRRIERGIASGSLESFGMVLEVLGLEQALGDLAAPERDILGQSADTPRLPKRVVRGRSKSPGLGQPIHSAGPQQRPATTLESLSLPKRARQTRAKEGAADADDIGSAW